MLHGVWFHILVDCLSKMDTVATEWEIMSDIMFPYWVNHLSLDTSTAPARDPTCSGSQSAREADGEGDTENEED